MNSKSGNLFCPQDRGMQQLMILFMPIFPYLTDDFENINGVVKAVSDAGAKDLVQGVLDLRASCRNRVLSLVEEEFPELLPKYLALYKTVYAPKDYVGKIYQAVETARRKCGLKKFEMHVLREKQTKLSVWVDL
jgi:DNA repair photolyase